MLLCILVLSAQIASVASFLPTAQYHRLFQKNSRSTFPATVCGVPTISTMTSSVDTRQQQRTSRGLGYGNPALFYHKGQQRGRRAFSSSPLTAGAYSTTLESATGSATGEPLQSLYFDQFRFATATPSASSSEGNKNNRNNNMKPSEMVTGGVLGTLFTVLVIFVLGTTGEVPKEPELSWLAPENLGGVTDNIVDAAVPLTATDLVAVVLGEGSAALVAAGATCAFGLFSKIQTRLAASRDGPTTVNTATVQPVADGNFLWTGAAILPVLEAIGISSLSASIATVLIAVVPYELIKYESRILKQREEEDRIMEQLLLEQMEKERKERSFFGIPLPEFLYASNDPVVDVATLKPAEEKGVKFDVVEVLYDLIKWLGYSVLFNEFSGQMVWQGENLSLIPGAESAVLGALAGLAAQAYADIVYGVFGFGGLAKRNEVRSRTIADWTTLIVSTAIYSAILFGVYETAQIPSRAIVSAFLSGGMDGCAGSADYNLCIESYIVNNPPGASPEAEVRSLITSLVSLWNRFGAPYFS